MMTTGVVQGNGTFDLNDTILEYGFSLGGNQFIASELRTDIFIQGTRRQPGGIDQHLAKFLQYFVSRGTDYFRVPSEVFMVAGKLPISARGRSSDDVLGTSTFQN